ncbi:MAG: Imidazoleglycerol-phosphate dehydratase, partial [uncultured Corynebacteriales bacterium]
EPDRTGGAGDQGVLGAGRGRPRRHRPDRRRHRRAVLRPHAVPAGQARRLRPDDPDPRRPGDRRPPHGGGHRDRAGRGVPAGAGGQVRAAPVRRRAGAAGRGAGPGRGGPVRPAVPGAHRAGHHAADDRPGVRDHADPARLRVLRAPRADRAARPGARRPGRPPHRGGAVQGGRPGAARRDRGGPEGGRRAQHQGGAL